MRRTMLVAMALAVTACGGGDGDDVVLGIDDNLREVEVAAGATIEVRLESNASTGYRWAPNSLPAVLELSDDRHEEADTDLVGAPGTQVMTFTALREGAGILRLEYARPSDDPPIAAQVVEYVVRIDGAPWPPDDPGPLPSTSTAAAPVGVGELDGQAAGPAVVTGFVVWDADGPRLCEVLLESFPPQCGGAAVVLDGADALDVTFEEEGGVRWTQDRVTVTGDYDGARLAVTG